jgi:hypothetical protein
MTKEKYDKLTIERQTEFNELLQTKQTELEVIQTKATALAKLTENNSDVTPELSRKSAELSKSVGDYITGFEKDTSKFLNSDKNDKLLGDTYETIIKMIDNFKEFISNLTVEQLCLVINLSISIVILTLIINIFTIISGNFLINFLNLEKK